MKTKLFLIGLLLLASLPVCTSAEETQPARKAPILDLDGPIVEVANPLALFGEPGMVLRDLTATIDKARDDEEVAALVIKFGRPAAGLAQLHEIHDHLVAFRQSGKPLVAWFDIASPGGYMIAATADHVVMPEVGMLMTPGLAVQMYYFKDMLGKIGIEAEVVNTGKFKTAMEPFTHNTMSEGNRIQLTEILGDIADAIVESVAANRAMDKQTVEKVLWTGPFESQWALDKGLITEIAYYDEFLDRFAEENDLEYDEEYQAKPKKKKESINLFTLFSDLGKDKKTTKGKERIALVYALGGIMDGRAEQNPFQQGQVIASEDFLDMLDDVMEEGETKAIVLRVDSPGGSAVASDRIWNKLEEIQAQGVPVIVTMGNVAASGGYYISMGADKIVAEPTTLTGSIGVVGGKFNMGGTYELIGVKKEILSRGQNATLFDESTPWNDVDREVLNALLDATYDAFTRKAAEGRGVSQDRIKELGGGRVWTGLDAKEIGLVDELGGIDDALDIAREMIDQDDIEVVSYPRELTFFEMIEKVMGGGMSAQAVVPQALGVGTPGLLQTIEAILPPQQVQTLLTAISLMRDQPVILTYHPMAFEIR